MQGDTISRLGDREGVGACRVRWIPRAWVCKHVGRICLRQLSANEAGAVLLQLRRRTTPDAGQTVSQTESESGRKSDEDRQSSFSS